MKCLSRAFPSPFPVSCSIILTYNMYKQLFEISPSGIPLSLLRECICLRKFPSLQMFRIVVGITIERRCKDATHSSKNGLVGEERSRLNKVHLTPKLQLIDHPTQYTYYTT